MAKNGPTNDHPHLAESAMIIALGVATIFAPLALGATGAWPRGVLELLMAAVATFWALTGNRPKWAMGIPLAMAGLVALQLIPLPDSLLRSVAPLSAAAWKVANEGTGGRWGCVSIDPGGTATAGRRLFVALSTLMVVADLGKSKTLRHRMMASLAAAGLLALLLGVLFPVDFKDRVLLTVIDLKGPISFWKTPLAAPVQTAGFGQVEVVRAGNAAYRLDEGSVGDGFGSYICSNHFAGALCLTIPVAIATSLSLFPRKFHSAAKSGASVALAIASLWVAGGLAGSRAGALGLGFGLAVLTWLNVRRSLPSKLSTAIVVVYAVGIITLLVVLYGSFQQVSEYAPAAMKPKISAVLNDARVRAAAVAGRMFVASPLLGTGLATFPLMYPRVVPGTHVLFYAHNDYAQLLAESGLVGGLITALLVWWMVRVFVLFVRGLSAADSAWDTGPWAALAGIAAHSAFDWNMHVPANAFLTCIVTGLAISSPYPKQATQVIAPRSFVTAALTGVFIISCVTAAFLLTRDAYSESVQHRLRRAITADRLVTRNPGQPTAIAELSAAVEVGRQAARWDSWNARLAVLLGQADLHIAKEVQPIDDVNRYRLDAAAWFSKAQLNCAACRGLPEVAP